MDIKGYEEDYEVSNNGRVRTKEGKTTYSNGNIKRVWKQRILKLKKDKKGYKRVTLWKNNKSKDFLVHRLVATAFIPINKNKRLVNHKDGNPKNNHFSNLEWCTAKENVNHAFENNLMTTQHSIVLVHNKSNEAHYFYSMAKASEFLGKNKGYISSILKRGIYTTDGFDVFIRAQKVS